VHKWHDKFQNGVMVILISLNYGFWSKFVDIWFPKKETFLKKAKFLSRFIPDIPVLAIPFYSGFFWAGIFTPLCWYVSHKNIKKKFLNGRHLCKVQKSTFRFFVKFSSRLSDPKI
jgi:hypothetical protein